MNIKYRDNVRAFTLLVIITTVAIVSSAQSAQTQVLVLSDPILPMGKIEQITFSPNLSRVLVQTNNDSADRFLKEQLANSSSTTPTTLQSNNSGWTQPIGWLFGLVFVVLGTLVAWSKYMRKR